MNSTNERWLLSEKASSLFLLSSVIVLTAGLAVVVLSELAKFTALREELSTNPFLYIPLGVVLAANAFSALFLLVGMSWYWIRFDDSRRTVKLLWLGSFAVTGWYSMAIYYFFVYRRHRTLRRLPR